MKAEELDEKYWKYRENLVKAFSTLRLTPEGQPHASKISEVISLAECYRKDAEHFHRSSMKVTALISLAYGEGLLDALKILGYVDFEWGWEKP